MRPPRRLRRPGRPRGLLGAVTGVAGLTLLSRSLGFLRWVVQATTVGAGTVAGAYATANQIPNVLYEVVVGGALAATVVPLLAAPLAAGRAQDAEKVARGLLGLVLALLVPLGALVALAAPWVAGALPVSQGADPALQRELVTAFLRMFALQVPLYGVGVVLTGVLQAHGRFTWPALTPVASSLVVMASYGAYATLKDHDPGTALGVLGWGTTAGVAALSLPLAWPVRRLGLRITPTLRLERHHLARLASLGGAGTWSLLAQQASVLAVLALARSAGQAGTVAVYQYSQAVTVLPYAVLAVPVATVLYPRLTQAVQEDRGQHPGLGRTTPSPATVHLAGQGTALVLAVALAGAAVLAVAAPGAEAFFSLLTDVEGMGASLAATAPALVGLCLVYQGQRVLFALDRARDAAAAVGAGWAVVVAASWAATDLLAPQGGQGAATLLALGAGQSAGMAAASAGLLWALSRALGPGALRGSGRVLAAGAPAALAAGGAGHLLVSHLATWAGGGATPGAGRVAPVLAAALVCAALAGACVLASCLLAERDLLRPLRPAQAVPPVAPDPDQRAPRAQEAQ